jgi:hypothetical protein
MGLIKKYILNKIYKGGIMQINVGADELILWLRKNNKATGVENIVLGRKIIDLITKLGGQPIIDNQPSIWANDLSDNAMARLGLAKTSEQYKIDTTILPNIYEELVKW